MKYLKITEVEKLSSTSTFNPEIYTSGSDMQFNTSLNLLEEISIDDNSLVLDIGCGDGAITSHFSNKYQNSTIVGIDINIKMLQFGMIKYKKNSRIHFVQCDAHCLSFKTRFDFVYSFWALSWITNHEKMLISTIDSLNENGHLLLLVPLNNPTFLKVTNAIERNIKYSYFLQGFKMPTNLASERLYRSIIEKHSLNLKVKKVSINYFFSSKYELLDYIKGWMPHVQLIPDHLKDIFMEDIYTLYINYSNNKTMNKYMVCFDCLKVTR